MIKILKIILFIICLFQLAACAKLNVNTRSTMGNFYERINTKEFFKRGTFIITLDESTNISSVSLFQVPQIVQVGIDISECDQVLYVNMIEKNYLNINRQLLMGKEYLFDSQKGKLFVLIDLPIVYFFKNRIDVFLDILSLNTKGRFTKTMRKKIIFNWKPLVATDTIGFVYGDLSHSQELIENQKIDENILKELKLTAIERFNSEYKDEIANYLKKRNLIDINQSPNIIK